MWWPDLSTAEMILSLAGQKKLYHLEETVGSIDNNGLFLVEGRMGLILEAVAWSTLPASLRHVQSTRMPYIRLMRWAYAETRWPLEDPIVMLKISLDCKPGTRQKNRLLSLLTDHKNMNRLAHPGRVFLAHRWGVVAVLQRQPWAIALLPLRYHLKGAKVDQI